MQAHITFFEARNINEITGLNDDELWAAGFELDDFDFGFVSDIELDKSYVRSYTRMDYEAWEEITETYTVREENPELPYFATWLILRASEYCVGYQYNEYDGKHWYLLHHA